MNKKIIEIKNAYKSFDQPVLVNLQLTTYHGEFIVLIGESGSGKSTLFNILSGIDHLDTGDYYFLERKIDENVTFSENRLNNIGFVFQEYNLIDDLSARENINLQAIFTNMSDEKVNDKTERLINEFNLMSFADRKISVLSGGELQRVALARSVFMDPLLLLADEPTGNLDEHNAKIIMSRLKKINNQGTTIIMITHDYSLIKYASRVLKLEKGFLREYKA